MPNESHLVLPLLQYIKFVNLPKCLLPIKNPLAPEKTLDWANGLQNITSYFMG